MIKKTIVVKNTQGLHARPAKQFVNMAKKYASKINVAYGEKTINAKSILELMALGVGCGKTITITAEGEDEAKAVEGLIHLVESDMES